MRGIDGVKRLKDRKKGRHRCVWCRLFNQVSDSYEAH